MTIYAKNWGRNGLVDPPGCTYGQDQCASTMQHSMCVVSKEYSIGGIFQHHFTKSFELQLYQYGQEVKKHVGVKKVQWQKKVTGLLEQFIL